jgi:DNA-directed RNA polymerase specialized sigma24 family protein
MTERTSFPTTHWSIVVCAHDGSESQARTALETLCRSYWYPLYSYTRGRGHSHHEAEDLTQEFLARLLASDAVVQARPERGRFRTFLLTGLRNFLIKDWERSQAAKRGGGNKLLSLDFGDAEQTYRLQPADPGLTPEEAFDRTWAIGMVERAMSAIRTDYERSGRGGLFAALAPFVWGGTNEALAVPAAQLGMNVHACTVALQRLRQRVSQRLRAAVAETVANEEEVDVELRHLIAAASGISRRSRP